MKELVIRVRNMGLAVLRKLDFVPPLLARFIVGWIFYKSGWGKLHNLPQVIEFFQSLGIPAARIQAPMIATLELVCGVLLLTGLLTRLAAIPMIGTMVVAILTAKKDDIHTLGDLFATSELLYIALLVWLIIAGPGRIALDTFVARLLDGKKSEGAAS